MHFRKADEQQIYGKLIDFLYQILSDACAFGQARRPPQPQKNVLRKGLKVAVCS